MTKQTNKINPLLCLAAPQWWGHQTSLGERQQCTIYMVGKFIVLGGTKIASKHGA